MASKLQRCLSCDRCKTPKIIAVTGSNHKALPRGWCVVGNATKAASYHLCAACVRAFDKFMLEKSK